MGNANDKRLFWACWIALISTSFGFITRMFLMGTWATEFGLTETQAGEIRGAWLWPFAISIVLFSLIIDRIGYGRAMGFAFAAQIASAVITLAAPAVYVAQGGRSAYWTLYLGNFVGALGNGTVEAVINPVVATMFVREKTKWLNILHAGWPGGLVLAGCLFIGMGAGGVLSSVFNQGNDIAWQWKVGMGLIPTLVYGVAMFGCKFPINERVAAGVPFKVILQEAGILGGLVVTTILIFQLTQVVADAGMAFAGNLYLRLGLIALVMIPFGLYVQALGRPMFFFLLLIMMPLAITELGTDSWIQDLMEPEMRSFFKVSGGWVLVYTSFIMLVLRFFAGPIVHKLSPLGLLAISAGVAMLGLASLSLATGLLILAAATLYGFGKTFFWPTMLGVVSEQFPKGGALTLNAIAAVGMLAVGIIGAPLLGFIQDQKTAHKFEAKDPQVYSVATENKSSLFGEYTAVNPAAVTPKSKDFDKTVTAVEKDVAKNPDSKVISKLEDGTTAKQLDAIQAESKKETLLIVAVFPAFMLVCYLILIFYFYNKGGYKAEVLVGHKADDKEFTGGVPAPAEL